MARVNVYLPDDLAEEVRAAGLNVSALTRLALEDELAAQAGTAWLQRLAARPRRSTVQHSEVLDAIDGARSELDGDVE